MALDRAQLCEPDDPARCPDTVPVHRAVGLLMLAFGVDAVRANADTEPEVLRHALAFIHRHAGEPIGLTEIAGAASISGRELQHAFRRHRDTTPLAYLRRTRLEGAHLDLRGGDPRRGDTVASIASRWGFGHPGRLSIAYRQCYQEPPSHTLRTAEPAPSPVRPPGP